MPGWSQPSEEKGYNPNWSALVTASSPATEMNSMWKLSTQETKYRLTKVTIAINRLSAIQVTILSSKHNNQVVSALPAAEWMQIWKMPIQETEYLPTLSAMVVSCSPAIMSSKPIEEANYGATKSVMVVSGPAITH